MAVMPPAWLISPAASNTGTLSHEYSADNRSPTAPCGCPRRQVERGRRGIEMQGAGGIVRTAATPDASATMSMRASRRSSAACAASVVSARSSRRCRMLSVGADGATENAHARIPQCAEVDGAPVRPPTS